VIGSVFGLICLLGIVAGIYPSRCSRLLHFQKKSQSKSVYDAEQGGMGERNATFEGHHPSCGNFSSHVFQLGDRKYCAGCTGLVIGAVVSLFGTLWFLFAELFLGYLSVVFLGLGLIGVALGILQYNLFNMQRSFVHLSLNVIFVLGAFFLLIGIEEVTSSLVLEVYFVALTLFWVLTRILLSQLEHRRICIACGLKSCRFLD